MASNNLKWYDKSAKREIRALGQVGLVRTAFLARRQVRRNITENAQIDTKHMWQTAYVATPNARTPIPPDGDYVSSKTGKLVHRESGPIVQPKDGAYVGVAASHAIYQELRESFLYKALSQVAGREAEQAMAGLGTGLFMDDGDEE